MKKRLEEGIFNVWQFTDAVEKFLNLSIGDSLTSKNPLIQLLAIVDRRVGIRTLKKIMNSISEQPMWLQYFYKLRLQAEEVV
ncbi:SF0329 family protein [Clostridium tetani]|uniref:SF0329 family protein n=1 Tax=Clostridium tetani TaxID=1513 RepID=UPI003BB8B7C4